MILLNELDGDVAVRNEVLEGETLNRNLNLQGNVCSASGKNAVWGAIAGVIDDQEDLKQLLDSKADLSDIPTVPTKTSDLVNDSGFITSAAVPSKVSDLTNDLSFVESSNLATVATSGNYGDLSNTPVIPIVPSNVSAFTNDVGYLTSNDVASMSEAEIDEVCI